ncbi:S41 family peptidase [soil metagenome]
MNLTRLLPSSPRLATSFALALLMAPALLVVPSGGVAAQDAEAQREAAQAVLPEGEAAWLRYPALSPDGQTLVFTYRGDLWRVGVRGGDATRLTNHPAHDHTPVWSPDGRHVAFASDRFGSFQLFVMPAQGGEPRRLTFHSTDETPFAFTPDGSHVVFGASRLDDPENRQFPSGSLPELYQVPVEGGRVSQLLTLPAEDVSISEDGRIVVYHDRKGGENIWRKYHTSAITRDLWVWDREADSHRQLTNADHESRTPVLVPGSDHVFFLSEESGSYNVHRIPLAGGASEPVTRFRGQPVRFLSAARDGTLAFGHDGLLYTLPSGASEPTRVPVRIASDWRENDERVISVSGGISDFSVSPSGKELAFLSRGEVFATSLETGTTQRITSTPERETSIHFLPDTSAIIYASERDGRWGIWEARRARSEEPYFFVSTLLEEHPVVVNDRNNSQPLPSPDGNRLAFIEDYHTLRVLDRESGDVTTLLTEEHIFSGGQFEWSPDGNWILFTWAVPGRATRDIGVVRADGSGQIHNLTQSGFSDTGAQWILGGRGMIWRSNRDGLRSLQASGSTEADVYAMYFTQDAWEESRLSKEELELRREMRGETGQGNRGARGENSSDTTSAAATHPAPDELDWESARERRTRLTIHSSALGGYLVTKDGENLHYLARFERGLNLWSTNLRTQETRQVLTLNASSASISWNPAEDRIVLVAGGSVSIVNPSNWTRTNVPVSGEMMVSQAAERAAMFDQMWRRVDDAFYTRTFHGADWDAVRTTHEKFLPHIGNNHEFAELLSEALGELNVSHSGAGYSSSSSGDDATAALGVFFNQSPEAVAEPGMHILEVMRGGPLDRADLDIRPGAVIESIDGEAVTADVDPARLLNRKAGNRVLLRVRDPLGSGSSEVTEVVVQPITGGAENSLRYDRWVEMNRREVEELSGGRLGYVHVQGMNDRVYRSTFEEVLGRHFDKDGMVIDTRYNPGGDLVADLEMFFSGRRFFEYTTDDRSSGFEPSFRWTRPSVTLVSEGNYSDGHCFAWAYQEMGIGPLIGMPVHGTCTFGGGNTLLDGLRFGVPARGVKDARSGRFLENWQTEPDIVVPNEPGVVTQGRDQQLERAVQELLRVVGG